MTPVFLHVVVTTSPPTITSIHHFCWSLDQAFVFVVEHKNGFTLAVGIEIDEG
jgi:hypothetical protein